MLDFAEYYQLDITISANYSSVFIVKWKNNSLKKYVRNEVPRLCAESIPFYCEPTVCSINLPKENIFVLLKRNFSVIYLLTNNLDLFYKYPLFCKWIVRFVITSSLYLVHRTRWLVHPPAACCAVWQRLGSVHSDLPFQTRLDLLIKLAWGPSTKCIIIKETWYCFVWFVSRLTVQYQENFRCDSAPHRVNGIRAEQPRLQFNVNSIYLYK